MKGKALKVEIVIGETGKGKKVKGQVVNRLPTQRKRLQPLLTRELDAAV
ncbi:hypothetical protein [Salinicola halimionae]|nr:hypothetical protein [Salinicola halimionae]